MKGNRLGLVRRALVQNSACGGVREVGLRNGLDQSKISRSVVLRTPREGPQRVGRLGVG